MFCPIAAPLPRRYAFSPQGYLQPSPLRRPNEPCARDEAAAAIHVSICAGRADHPHRHTVRRGAAARHRFIDPITDVRGTECFPRTSPEPIPNRRSHMSAQ